MVLRRKRGNVRAAMGKETGSDVSGRVCGGSGEFWRKRQRSREIRRSEQWNMEKCQQTQVDGKVEKEQVNT